MVERTRRPDGPGIARLLLALTTALVLVGLGACADDAPSGGDDGVAASSSTASDVAGGEPAASDDECRNVHAGHASMMWTAEMADEMADAGCGWPYEPYLVPLDGGEDDPALDAAFSGRRYAELWTAITGSGLGLCSVGTAESEPDVGLAFGFTYLLGPPGCPGAAPTGGLLVGEYGTEAQRDRAAHAAAGAGDAEPAEVYVLGRWVVRLDGDALLLGDALAAAGGQRVT